MIKIKNEELIKELLGEARKYPLYVTQLLNLANQNAQGTRPKVVGQMTQLIQECPARTYEGWKKWYLSKYPNAIGIATEKIDIMIQSLRQALKYIDKPMTRRWVEDLVIGKTFTGLRAQAVILKRVASIKGTSWRLSNQKEEAKGIDGFIGSIPVSIKPITYKAKNSLQETLSAKIIFYGKTKSGLEINADVILKNDYHN